MADISSIQFVLWSLDEDSRRNVEIVKAAGSRSKYSDSTLERGNRGWCSVQGRKL